ncbi:DNA-directed DNA polymerase [Bryobacterales bacterium F-183]|nr:DNA-directed DNA polymerase [Bryobacterales bacterium F-183]
MSNTPFVHLHCHTDYSLLDGACEISQMMEIVEKQKMPSIAMTDHGNLFGAVEFYNAAKGKGIHPVIGCEMYVAQKGRTDRSDSNRYNHLVLLCENQEGYKNLIKLVSMGFLEGFYYKPRIDKDILAQHSKGLIALSACLRGDLNEALTADKYDEAKRLAYEYSDMFGKNNFFLEMQEHGIDLDKQVISGASRLSSDTGIPLVVTNDAHYLQRSSAHAHEILLCIQTGKTMSDVNRMKFNAPEYYLKTKEEMMTLFGDYEHALDRAYDISQRCNVKLESVANPFPKFDVPEGESIDSYFAYVARQGFERRRPRLEAMAAAGQLRRPMPEYIHRLEREIAMIQKMKFSGYFLIVWDFIRFSKQNGIPVGPGRGSAAGSLVSYAMQITDIDPLQYDLLFERFLNPERISMPDIDIDFCTHRRGEVIQYVTEKYGREQVAQIITFGTLGARAAIKDVGRALEIAFGDVDKVTKLIPTQPLNIKLKQALEMEPNLGALAKSDARIQEVLDVSLELEGMARNASVHAAGVVISPQPLAELVPLYKTNRDEIVTQYDMVGLEKLGLLKMDFLGLTTLTIITDACKLIERFHGVKLDIEDIPLNEQKTYDIFGKGYTSGVFQFESPGMRDILRRYQPDRLEDLIALNALYRPGPMDMIDDFIDRKHGKKEVTYELPEMKEVLEETFGVMVYQEQVMQMSNKLAGYSLGDADILRRAMGKKKKEEMDKQRERFVAGALALGFNKKKIERVFETMAKFAGYGFNKSHSAAYAYLAYVTAYLKANYPIEFMSALLTSETGNTAKVVKYIAECRDMGIKVLPPDVNESLFSFAPAGQAIRFGLGAIKNVGANAVEAVIKAREDKGRFKTIFDFCERVDMAAVNRRVIESFIKAGAFDSVEGTRAQKMAVLDSAIETGLKASRDRESGQGGLFGDMFGAVDDSSHAMPLPNVRDWTDKEKLGGEKEMIGFFITGHPLDQYADKVSELNSHATDALEGLEKGYEVKICGILTSLNKRRNKKGEPWASLVLEDRNGAVDGMIFASQYERLIPYVEEDKAVLVRAMVLPEENAPPKLSIQDITPLDNARVNFPSAISITCFVGIHNGNTGLEPQAKAEELHKLLARKQGGPTEVRLQIEKPRDFRLMMDLPVKVRPDKEFNAEVVRICGGDALKVVAG